MTSSAMTAGLLVLVLWFYLWMLLAVVTVFRTLCAHILVRAGHTRATANMVPRMRWMT
jgi:hypothetical protein